MTKVFRGLFSAMFAVLAIAFGAFALSGCGGSSGGGDDDDGSKVTKLPHPVMKFGVYDNGKKIDVNVTSLSDNAYADITGRLGSLVYHINRRYTEADFQSQTYNTLEFGAAIGQQFIGQLIDTLYWHNDFGFTDGGKAPGLVNIPSDATSLEITVTPVVADTNGYTYTRGCPKIYTFQFSNTHAGALALEPTPTVVDNCN